MINTFHQYHMPVCDCCGAHLAAEYDDEAAEAAMEAAGWAKRDGKDVCRLCLRKEAETGRLPERQRYWQYTRHLLAKGNKEPPADGVSIPQTLRRDVGIASCEAGETDCHGPLGLAMTGEGTEEADCHGPSGLAITGEGTGETDRCAGLSPPQNDVEDNGAGRPEEKEKETEHMDENLITGACEAETESDVMETLLTDTVRSIRRELERVEDRSGARFNSSYESYSVLIKALEDKSVVEKDLKDAVKKLWEGVKSENEDAVLAFLGEIERVARESAMAWIHVAAVCQKAEESV